MKGGAPVDGQNQDYRPRTAGERRNASGPDGGVRDWQRNTWFGPAPQNSNPFEEPEDAPELREIRSANVTEHAGEFWNSPEKSNTGPVPSGRTAGSRTGRAKARPRAIRVIAGSALFIVALLLILRFAVFSVKQIYVNGNSAISAEDVIRASGIRRGANILSLNEKNVEERLRSDPKIGYRLQFRYMATQLPSTVLLSVREREPCCWLTYCGIMYVMDKNRMVLYESENPSDQPQNLVEIKGLEVRSNTLVGQYINLGNEAQQSIFTELFLEMKVLGCTDQIKEADISNTGSILLLTRDGYTAALGDRNNLHAKLRSLLLVQEELKQQEYFGGTISVTNPETPIYTP
ncbi:MAG: FtsQ-type POTRA domain-containing protein [Clostridia bacterium]|nr:FtsQ-type POTRA domain-containing protein [Clostridia bacterium]